ncbi:MAG: helix-turn-helix domain-containing protein [Desulfovibrionaceae bacterium]
MNAKDVKTALPGYFTTTEAAEALGYVATNTLSRLCAEGRVVCYKVGKTWLIPVEQVQILADKETGNRGGRGHKRS